ncbi:DUF6809 family protein [Pelotomaculum sp. PtaB.Bin117]|uniref:DUF6809 family protein n=1 Tax=Pelotomaculum sp. PtaB.Bin117 TaxID=1811694 RepID=UPI0009CDD5D5|nr:DUF6809 family protein [Pelotomaculum sp. PtaB.Bin117]OPX87134.1 MAG: hypothetical protein A4E54_01797 [Pelotomaculum sp. PtaB.Bin117]OPY62238.1 MAG: hypothetical protein A4E56_01495 [Pelotomaculum sp. PtaU1.Bin065]
MQRKYYTMRGNSIQGIVESNNERMVFMQSILEELYCGNIQTDSRRYEQNSPFVQTARLKHDNLEKLTSALDDCERFQEMSSLHMQLSSAEEDNLFSYAFTLGMLLTMDLMKEAEGIING